MDAAWVDRALVRARRAARRGEIPIGAVVVLGERALGWGGNRPIGRCDPTAHAEILALRAAARRQANYRLPGCDLYVTLEPCLMCLGAAVHARIRRLVFGAFDPKVGASALLGTIASRGALNHQIVIRGGVRAAECGDLLKEYFRGRRAVARPSGPLSPGTPARRARGGAGRRTAG
jgi:tRNA(Arg) A34 adenosine deaminase TadA